MEPTTKYGANLYSTSHRPLREIIEFNLPQKTLNAEAVFELVDSFCFL
jgi:hypothetical protein